MSFSLPDFEHTLDEIEEIFVKRVIAAWGESGDYAEWSGGFLCELTDGRFAYVSGWCDTSGWGCQGGANIKYFDEQPQHSGLEDRERDWELDPTDLNIWVVQHTTFRKL